MLGLKLIVNGKTDGRTENRTPISHLAKADATKIFSDTRMSEYQCFFLLSTYRRKAACAKCRCGRTKCQNKCERLKYSSYSMYLTNIPQYKMKRFCLNA